ncbi:uroporphyrinogen decarboxylase family protein [uncultured Cohaesibacter sp.]|uniref:uroporphyrinogen decarboxylase family protein n=1 Tax=uncultured Cohaesibacter sp. TaxID=1002546 RepID=UPI002931B6EC|nr:uroporphyrinogen decarboxylase family protein [uncultured Cohaesibacter sp.]
MTKTNEELLKERQDRIEKALAFEKVDRVPFLFSGPGYAPVSKGLTLADFCSKPDDALNASLDTLDDLNAIAEIDGINTSQAGCFPCLLTEQWWARVDVPGFELPENELWQVHEEEVMKPEDYDFIIENGWDAYVEVIRPKIHNPELIAIHAEWMEKNVPTLGERYRSRGFEPLCGAVTEIPFETVCGGRSMGKFFRDCYKMPDKVDEVLKLGMDFWTNLAIGASQACGIKGVWVGGWRAASNMVSPKIWNRFVWPYYVELIEKLVAADVRCILHFDSNWDRDVERFLELPGKGCVLSTDGSTDLRRARDILGDHMPVLGDVPSSILAAGTPEEVRAYVRDLIKDLGKTGLIMNTGCDMPYNTPLANVEALVLATHEFGCA